MTRIMWDGKVLDGGNGGGNDDGAGENDGDRGMVMVMGGVSKYERW